MEYPEDRVIPRLRVGCSIAFYALNFYTGVSEGLAGAAAVELLSGGLTIMDSAWSGELTKFYTDPWITVSVDRKQVYPYKWW